MDRRIFRDRDIDLGAFGKLLAWLIYFALLVAGVYALNYVGPAETTMTSTYTLPYFPPNLDATTITNKFVVSEGLGGAGGIAMTQADYGTLEEYIAKSSETEGTHYLSFESHYSYDEVNYYYERPGSMILRHYSYRIPYPRFTRGSFAVGSYGTTTYEIADGKVVTDGRFAIGDGFGTLLLFVWVIFSAAYALIVEALNKRFYWWD